MKAIQQIQQKFYLYSLRMRRPLVIATAILAASCGDSNKSAGDRAKSATDAVVKKTDGIKDAVVGEAKPRAEVDAQLVKQRDDLKAKLSELESQISNETIPAVKTAAQTRLESVKLAFKDANDRVSELRKTADAEWKGRKDAAIVSLENAQTKVVAAMDRQTFTADVRAKLDRLESRIETLKTDSANATAEAKQKMEADRNTLEGKYDELKADYNSFQLSTEEKWDSFKEKFSKAFGEVSSSFTGLFD